MAGYSGTPLVKKLGLTDGLVATALNSPPEYRVWISPLPSNLVLKEKLTGETDFIHLFVQDRKTLDAHFSKCLKHLKKTGMIWISWPKKSSKVPTDLDENLIRATGLELGLVDVKVCAVTEIWSGLKFVYRLKDR